MLSYLHVWLTLLECLRKSYQYQDEQIDAIERVVRITGQHLLEILGIGPIAASVQPV